MKKKIKLSIISTLLLTSTLTITLPIVSCSSSTNPTIPTNPPIYTIDATRFDSNKLVKINEVISSIVNDPNSTTQQKIIRYKNLNAYANNSELIKSVNDYFFLIDKNNNDKIIKDVIEQIEIIPTSNPTLTHGQAMPKVTIKINVKQEFIKYIEDTNFSSYSFDTGTLDRLGDVKINITFDIDSWKKWIMEYVGTNTSSGLTFAQQSERISTSNLSVRWSANSHSPTSSPTDRWDIAQRFLSVKIASSSTPINSNIPFFVFTWLNPVDLEISPGITLTGYRIGINTKSKDENANENNFLINHFNSTKINTPTTSFLHRENSSFGTLASA